MNIAQRWILFQLATAWFALTGCTGELKARAPGKPFAASTLSYFGYWDAGDPLPLDEELADWAGYVNTIMHVAIGWNSATQKFEDPWDHLSKAHAAGVKIIVGPENNLYADTLFPTIKWWGNDPVIFNAWVNLLTPYQNDIAAIWVADEADCGAPFP